jgi:beta-lactamase regulating signal transducer with metallopeptidase domain
LTLADPADPLAAPPAMPLDEALTEEVATADRQPLLESGPLESRRLAASLPEAATEPAGATRAIDWLASAVAWLWLAGAAAWFALAVVRMLRFGRILRHAESAGAELQLEVASLANQIGLARVPQVRLSQRRIPPLLWATRRQATMLLPAALLEDLSLQQRSTLLAHELVHLARRDWLVRWLEVAALGIYWWHPVAWWARRNVAQAQERCCDAAVVAMFPHSARAYAQTLLATVEFLAESSGPLPLGASGFSDVGHIQRRLTMILERTTTTRISWPLRAALAAVALVVLPISLHTLWAEPAADQPQKTSPGEESETKPAKSGESSIEERLERLEKMVEKLVAVKEIEWAKATEGRKDQKRPSRSHDSVAEGRRAQDLELEIQSSLAKKVRDAQMKFELSQTHAAHMQAADQQLKAVREAYDNGTATAEKVLEAIRRRTDARKQYAQALAQLADDEATDTVMAALLSSRVAAKEALADVDDLIKQMEKRGAPEKEIEQARDERNQFESLLGKMRDELDRATARQTAGEEYRAVLHGLEFLQIQQPRKKQRHVDEVEPVWDFEKLAKIRADIGKEQAAHEQMLRATEEELKKLHRRMEELNAVRAKILKAAEEGKAESKDHEQERLEIILDKRDGKQDEHEDEELSDDVPQKKPPRDAVPPADDGAQKPAGAAALDQLIVANQQLRQTRDTWKRAHEQARKNFDRFEPADEAQAREEYFQAKARTQQALEHFLPALR